MNITKVSPEVYKSLFAPRSVYGSVDFNLLNAPKADEVAWIAAFDDHGHPRMGLIAGLREGRWRAPFSAPFAEISVNGALSVDRACEFASGVAVLLGDFSLTLAPAFYDEASIPCLTAAFANIADKVTLEYNYHYPTVDVPDFAANLIPTARNKLRQAEAAGLQFLKTDDIERAYAVIAANRQSHGYPLAMSLEQVIATVTGPVTADFFLMTLGDADIAAAMVYRVTPEVAQVIYWGDAPGYAATRSMNLLPREVFAYYQRLGFQIVDVGPASTDGIPNLGLCRYKSSLACHLTPKPTLTITSPR